VNASELARQLDEWIRADIAARGGIGRRISKAATAVLGYEWAEDEPTTGLIRDAIGELCDGGGYIVSEPIPGFVYLEPPGLA
jgi:hypothetical protein